MTVTPTGETEVPSKNDGTPQANPTAPTSVPAPEDKTQESAVEELKKQLAQQEMRGNQLANQLKAKEDADAAAQAKELEEQNKFKDLYEQERVKREALEAETEEKEKNAEIEKSKQTILGEFNDEVKAVVEEAGMTLTDSDEVSVAAFKDKVEKISKRVGSPKVTHNNPNGGGSGEPLTGDALREVLQDEGKFHEYVMKNHPGIAAMTNPKS